MKLFSRIATATVLFAVSAAANATTYTGLVSDVLINQQPSDGTLRMNVQTNAATACVTTYLATSVSVPESVRKSWLSALLAAKIAGKTVTIVGTGVCDTNSIEGILSVTVSG